MQYRALALCVGLLVAGCDSSSSQCRATCSDCGPGEVCVSFWLSSAPAFSATCMKQCTDDRDCPNGYRCVVVDDAPDTGKPYPNACVSDSDPAPCAQALGEICSDEVGQYCDGETLITNGFGGSPNNLCGHERLHCDNGCEALDGGIDFPFARCR